MIGNKLTPFKFWCQKVLPTVYDDSLSYYEYLCKLNEYLNDVIEQINTLTEAEENFQEDLTSQWTAYKNGLNGEWLEYKTGLTQEWNDYKTQLTQAWTETKNYIDNYFNNLNVQTEINNKLDAMVLSGAFSDLLEPIVAEDIPTMVTAWLNENVDPVGSAVTVDSSLTISGSAADAKVTGDNIANMYSIIKNTTGYANIEFTDDYFIEVSTTINLTPQYNATYKYAVVECEAGDVFTVTAGAGSISALAFADSSLNVLASTTAWSALSDYIAIAPTNTRYLVINDNGQSGYAYWGKKYLIDNFNAFENKVNDYGILNQNVFNKNGAIESDKYLNVSTGDLATLEGYFTSDYMDIGGYGDKIILSYVHLYCFYDMNKIFISGDADSGYLVYDTKATIPTGAKYIRISAPTTYINNVQVGLHIDRNKAYIDYKSRYVFDKLNMYDDEIIVASDGSGDYTSLTEAVYENVNNEKTIRVKSGTYNIVTEYVNKFTQTVVDTLSDADDIGNNFQYGIFITNRQIIFESGSHVVCDWTGHTVDGTHRFCAFSIGSNAKIIGLDLDCTATFYAIHDDYGDAFNYYENVYENCRIIGHSIVNQNLIGGGCKPYSKHTISNCYFDNNETIAVDLRYHNTNIEGAEPVVWINNCYFAQSVNICYYGEQTTKMNAYVNNCTADFITKVAEGASTVDNVNLYTWNNITT